MTTATQQPAVRHCPDCGTPESGESRFCINCFHLKGADPNIKGATFLRRFSAYLLDTILIFALLIIGWWIWWFFVITRGQTPGKHLVGIYAVKDDGSRLGGLMNFVREFFVKFIAVQIASNFTFGIAFFVNFLFPLFDKNLQTIHDKVMSTIVVRYDPSASRQAQTYASNDPWSGQSS